MFTIPLPQIGTDIAWRDAAKRLIGAGIAPDDILWDYAGRLSPLVDTPLPAVRRRLQVPNRFLTLANAVIWHQNDDRFARLYALLWRLRSAPNLMNDSADAGILQLNEYELDVQRAQAKMRKSVSFRDLRQAGARHSFAAWYTPAHHIVEPCAPYFAQRLPDLDWMIATPQLTAQFIDGNLSFHPGQPKPDFCRNRARIDRDLGDLFNPSGTIHASRV
ncbi:probable DNA metabolism protein [Yoonia tamlensis]|uniref:Probable DNA metabolism protein n=1 Tax=Yoonia tamlensis TaxID=390270 RepID=A0A1I6FVL1_9RHOB|nr:DUF4130 domain-containing protein [Yoonia tamlensis]SFR33961.1 probable DNA metabolism protein [Yoonia tamlensis]